MFAPFFLPFRRFCRDSDNFKNILKVDAHCSHLAVRVFVTDTDLSNSQFSHLLYFLDGFKIIDDIGISVKVEVFLIYINCEAGETFDPVSGVYGDIALHKVGVLTGAAAVSDAEAGVAAVDMVFENVDTVGAEHSEQLFEALVVASVFSAIRIIESVQITSSVRSKFSNDTVFRSDF